MIKLDSCCSQMRDAISDPDVPITYISKFREIGISVLDGGDSSIVITHCPWCGAELPKSLRNRWFDTLEKLNIDPFSDSVPADYLDDRWYKSKDFIETETIEASDSEQ